MEYTREWAEEVLKDLGYKGKGVRLHDYLHTVEDVTAVKMALQILKAFDKGQAIKRIDAFRVGQNRVILVPRLEPKASKYNIQLRS